MRWRQSKETDYEVHGKIMPPVYMLMSESANQLPLRGLNYCDIFSYWLDDKKWKPIRQQHKCLLLPCDLGLLHSHGRKRAQLAFPNSCQRQFETSLWNLTKTKRFVSIPISYQFMIHAHNWQSLHCIRWTEGCKTGEPHPPINLSDITNDEQCPLNGPIVDRVTSIAVPFYREGRSVHTLNMPWSFTTA